MRDNIQNKYPVTKSPIKTVVGIRYDPCDLSEIYIYDQKQDQYLETTTPSKQVNREAPKVPGETKKTRQKASKESIQYFTKLREEYLKQHHQKQTVDFSSLFGSKQNQEYTQ